jgi:hypothetical protein
MGTWECLFKVKNARFSWNVGPSLLFWDEDVSPTIGFKLIWALGYAGGQGKRLLSGVIYKKGLGQLVAHNKGRRHSEGLGTAEGLGCGAMYRGGDHDHDWDHEYQSTSTGLSERAAQHVIRTGRPRARGALRARLGLDGRDR